MVALSVNMCHLEYPMYKSSILCMLAPVILTSLGEFIDLNTEGQVLQLNDIRRFQAGYYVCLAINGVSPAVKREIQVKVQCKITFHLPACLFVCSLIHPTIHLRFVEMFCSCIALFISLPFRSFVHSFIHYLIQNNV